MLLAIGYSIAHLSSSFYRIVVLILCAGRRQLDVIDDEIGWQCPVGLHLEDEFNRRVDAGPVLDCDLHGDPVATRQ